MAKITDKCDEIEFFLNITQKNFVFTIDFFRISDIIDMSNIFKIVRIDDFTLAEVCFG